MCRSATTTELDDLNNSMCDIVFVLCVINNQLSALKYPHARRFLIIKTQGCFKSFQPFLSSTDQRSRRRPADVSEPRLLSRGFSRRYGLEHDSEQGNILAVMNDHISQLKPQGKCSSGSSTNSDCACYDHMAVPSHPRWVTHRTNRIQRKKKKNGTRCEDDTWQQKPVVLSQSALAGAAGDKNVEPDPKILIRALSAGWDSGTVTQTAGG